MGEKTVLALNHPNKASLRTTVPMFIVKQWRLLKGQNLDWSLELHNGELVAIVRKDGSGKVDRETTATAAAKRRVTTTKKKK